MDKWMDEWMDSAECCNFLPLTVVVKNKTANFKTFSSLTGCKIILNVLCVFFTS